MATRSAIRRMSGRVALAGGLALAVTIGVVAYRATEQADRARALGGGDLNPGDPAPAVVGIPTPRAPGTPAPRAPAVAAPADTRPSARAGDSEAGAADDTIYMMAVRRPDGKEELRPFARGPGGQMVPLTAPATTGPPFAFGGVESPGMRAAFVVDASGAVSARAWAWAREKVEAAVERVQPVQRFAVVVAGDGAVSASPAEGLSQGVPDGKRSAIGLLARTRPAGAAALGEALRTVVRGRRAQVIYVVCGATNEAGAIAEWVGRLPTADRPVMHVFYVGSTDEAGEGGLRRLAGLTSGIYRRVAPAAAE